jgi:hypothetical protein
MREPSILDELPGGSALIDWFGHVPSFHDAELLEIELFSTKSSTLKIHTWMITEELDSQGYFVLDKHVVVTITMDQVINVTLSDFNLVGIIGHLSMTKVSDAYQFAWDVSYGVQGTIRARQARIAIHPGKPGSVQKESSPD